LAVQAALDADSTFVDLAAVVAGGLLLVFSMWWIYFDLPSERMVDQARREFYLSAAAAFEWGYGHYVVFGSVAAVGAGLGVAIDQVTGDSGLSDAHAGLAATLPVAIYVVTVWLLHYRHKPPGPMRTVAPPVTVALLLLASLTPEPVLLAGIVLAGLVAVNLVVTRDQPAPSDPRPATPASDAS
jgi:low temperature requirement protein LtrA